MEDKDLILSVIEWSRKAGESKSNYFILSNIVNNIIGIASYSLALFVSKYLRTNRPELASEELDTPEGI